MHASTPSSTMTRSGSTPPALRARGLSKSYRSPVLDNLDLDIEQGQFVAIMGPSGSGKSTLLHCLSGMDRPSGGSVLLGDTEITSLSEKELAALRLKARFLGGKMPQDGKGDLLQAVLDGAGGPA